MGLPSVFIEGGLVADPELAFSAAGKPWAKCRVVAKDRVRGDGGAWEDGDPLFIDVVCFGKYAENLMESCSKGDTVIVYGRMKERTRQAEDGSKRAAMQIVADAIGPSLLFHPYKKGDRVSPASPEDPWANQEPPF